MKVNHLPPPPYMSSNEFLTEHVKTIPEYTLSDQELKTIKHEGIEQFIFNRLNSSKYKASSIPDDLRQKVKQKIAASVKSGLPIHVTVPFGGYKKWQLPSYPYPDWAEVFNILYLREYLAPIAAAYSEGVLLNYFSDEIFISRMNNYPQSDIDEYNREFEMLLNKLNSFMPKGLSLKFSKIRDEISQEEILRRFDSEIPKLRDKWNSLTSQEQEMKLKKTERNYKGDLTKLSESQKQEVLFASTMVHEAFIFGDWEKGVPWAFGENMIALGFRYTGSWGIHLRSSRSSTVQFWIGTGALIKKNETYIPTIFTYQQFSDVQDKLKEEEVKVLDSFKNLNRIQVLEK